MKILFWTFLWILGILNCQLVWSDDAVLESNRLPIDDDMPSLANGHVGFVIYGDAILMNGLYNGVRGESHRARIPNYANIMTSIQCTDNCIYEMNMRKGYFQNRMNSGNNFNVVQQLYAHRFYNRAILNTFNLQRGSQSGAIAVNLTLSPGPEDSVDLSIDSSLTSTINGRQIMKKCYRTKLIEDQRYQNGPSVVCVAYTVPPTQLTLSASENSKTYTHVTAVGRTSNEVEKELADIFTAMDSSVNVLERHTSVWESHWNRFGITVEGNTKVNQIIHSSMFYLISNLPSEVTNQPKDPFYGLSPGGIPKGGVVYMHYQGHSFWDTETWMHPPMLLLNPKWSEDILSYRYNSKKAAADNARNTHYDGYRFPWESGFTGCEVTPDCCPEVVEYQHHIISDIAFAFRAHLAATRDRSWWEAYGCDIAYNTARFWASRVRYNETTKHYDIRNVMGPDEDHHDIDNNGYTNVNAAINLYFGAYAACECKDILKVSEADYAKFEEIARGLALLYDEKLDFHPQYEGYKGEMIKQADTVLLGYPLQLPMNASTKRNDLQFYDTVTRENGPAMTWAMHTIGFLDLEDESTAGRYFERSYSLYSREPFNVWSEAIPGLPSAGNFITGAGGFLQSVLNGYAGIRLNFDDLVITKSYLPPGTTKLTLNSFEYLQNKIRLEVTTANKILRVVESSNSYNIKVLVNGIEQGYLTNFITNPLTVARNAEIKLVPDTSFGAAKRCEMKETVVGQKVEHSPAAFTDDEWILGSNYLPEEYELPTLSNGHVGFVIYGDSVFMNGLYNGRNGQSHRARIPNYSNIDINLGCFEQNCAYHVHIKHGYFERIAYSGKAYKVTQHLYPHRVYNRIIVNRFVLERLEGSQDEFVALTPNPGSEESVDLRKISEEVYTSNGRTIKVRCYETLIVEDPTYQKEFSKVCVAHTEVPARLEISASQRMAEYIHLTAIGTTKDEVTNELNSILAVSAETYFNEHKASWEQDMTKIEISVTDNKHLNQILHSSLFYLISNLPSPQPKTPNGPFYGLSPSGLAKGDIDKEYNGHSFWDTEMWMLPPILLLNPKWSQNLLDYRYNVRKAAEDHAKNTNYTGYRFPWESAFTGREATPEWAWEVILFQHHITADIAFAYRSHLAATHDLDWWKNHGCDIALNTAKFWSSRVKFNETTSLYDIRNTMGPDEDHHDIDNNVYTNVIAAINLYLGDFASCSCKDMEMPEAKDFSKIARALTLLYDKERDFHPQFEGYNGESIKQADVVLVSYPLQLPMDASTKRNNLLIYENVTRETGPAMTWSMHTIGFLDIKDQANAEKMFVRSYSVYNHEPFKTWSENQPGVPGAGNFITGMGGFLQSVMNGYAGIRLHFDHLSITNFYNPPSTKGLTLSGVTYLGNKFKLEIKDDTATLRMTELSDKNLLKIVLKPSDKEYEVKVGEAITFKRDEELIIKAKTDPFGTCEMKETVLGSAAVLKINIIFVAAILALKYFF